MASLSIRRAFLFVVCVTLLASAGIPSFAADNDEGGPYGYYVPGPIKKLPNSGRPAKKTPFPAIVDWNTLKIRLERGMCFGTCPAYSVEIRGDGTVTYQGKKFVAISGKHTAYISKQALHQLYDAFVKAEFFSTFDGYAANVTDLPAYRVTLSFDNHSKAVGDYAGQAIGMPEEIGALENAIDTAAGTNRWVLGDEESFASLVAEHWDFHATDDEHLGLIASVAGRGNVDLVRKLLAAGVSAKNKFGCEGAGDAAYRGYAEIVEMLLDAGTPVHLDANDYGPYGTCDLLSAASTWSVPRILRAILNRRPDVNWQDQNGTTALMSLAGNAIMDKANHPDSDFAAGALLLIKAGAEVNLRNNSGASAIMMAHYDANLVHVLLAAGAKDINTPNGRGETPLMLTNDTNVALALLQSGADPWMVDKDGKTALEICRSTFGPGCSSAHVLEGWMAAHPKLH